MAQPQTAVPARLTPTLTVEKVVTNRRIDPPDAERLVEPGTGGRAAGTLPASASRASYLWWWDVTPNSLWCASFR